VSLLAPVAGLGRATLGLLAALGRVAFFAGQVLSHMLRPPFYLREFLHAVMQIGWFSLPVVGMTAVFTGGALGADGGRAGGKLDRGRDRHHEGDGTD